MHAGMTSKIRGRGSVFLEIVNRRSLIKAVLIRKAVAVGEIGGGLGDQASEYIELGLLGDALYTLNTHFK